MKMLIKAKKVCSMGSCTGNCATACAGKSSGDGCGLNFKLPFRK